jgi:hypothetical protein
MRRLLLLATATVSALILSGCATMNVSAHAERGIDFARYQTFAWGPADALPTGDPRLDNNPFFHDYFQGAVEKQMVLRGLEKAEWGTPDLLIHYHANVTQRFSVSGADREYGACASQDCQARVTEYEAGTFVLDVTDSYTNKVVWRGWAQTSVDGVIDNQDWLREHIGEAVTKMMKLFPRAVAARATH